MLKKKPITGDHLETAIREASAFSFVTTMIFEGGPVSRQNEDILAKLAVQDFNHAHRAELLLGWSGSINARKHLARLIERDLPKVSASAIIILGETSFEENFDIIANGLNSKHEAVQIAAAFTLGWNQGHRSKSFLLNEVQQTSQEPKKLKLLISALRMMGLRAPYNHAV